MEQKNGADDQDHKLEVAGKDGHERPVDDGGKTPKKRRKVNHGMDATSLAPCGRTHDQWLIVVLTQRASIVGDL
jgi:hypothetical protein